MLSEYAVQFCSLNSNLLCCVVIMMKCNCIIKLCMHTYNVKNEVC